MNIRKPVQAVSKGQALTATRWNDLAQTVNSLSGTFDVDAGFFDNEDPPSSVSTNTIWLVEKSRDEVTVRVENPQDENQYVDIDKAQTLYFRSTTGQTWVMVLQR